MSIRAQPWTNALVCTRLRGRAVAPRLFGFIIYLFRCRFCFYLLSEVVAGEGVAGGADFLYQLAASGGRKLDLFSDGDEV